MAGSKWDMVTGLDDPAPGADVPADVDHAQLRLEER
jgi:hypothetical protein